MASIDNIHIAFSDESLLALNFCLGFIMFGIALEIKFSDFKAINKFPKSVFTGVISQFLLLPFLTFLLILIFKPHPTLGLGMILVAACPGGNISNYISSISRANIALSVSLTALATLLCPILTPLNFELWGGALPDTREYLHSFDIAFSDMLRTVLLLLVLPLLLGLWVGSKYPVLVSIIKKPIGILSFLILIAFIGLALAKNFDTFKVHLSAVFVLVLLHNGVALAGGYFSGALARLPEIDRRSIAIETGIQNSGLGLIIIFTFFKGNGGMAIIAAWWGVWHIISGMLLAAYFNYRDRRLSRSEIAQT